MKEIKGFCFKDGRTLQAFERVECYYNLHQGGFSIKSIDKRNKDKGRVVAYSEFVQLKDATFHVSQPGLKKIREKGKKFVCAVVRGLYLNANQLDPSALSIEFEQLYFNPRRVTQFVTRRDKKVVLDADVVYFYDRHCAAKNVRYLPE